MNAFSQQISLCIGAPKCGTTWLDAVLRDRYADRMPAVLKETFHLDRHPGGSLAGYREHFEPGCQRPIEIAPSYLNSETAVRRSGQFDARRLLVFVRDPYQRAASDLLHSMSRGRAWLSPDRCDLSDRAIDDAESYSQYRRHVDRWLASEPAYLAVVRFPIVDASLFAEILADFLDVAPADGDAGWIQSEVNRRVYGAAIPRARWLSTLTRWFRPMAPRGLKTFVRQSSGLFKTRVSPGLRQLAVDEVERRFDFTDQQRWLDDVVGPAATVLVPLAGQSVDRQPAQPASI